LEKYKNQPETKLFKKSKLQTTPPNKKEALHSEESSSQPATNETTTATCHNPRSPQPLH